MCNERLFLNKLNELRNDDSMNDEDKLNDYVTNLIDDYIKNTVLDLNLKFTRESFDKLYRHELFVSTCILLETIFDYDLRSRLENDVEFYMN